MSYYKINFKQLRQKPHIAYVLFALERGLIKYNINFYFVGAAARDVRMSVINGILPSKIIGEDI